MWSSNPTPGWVCIQKKKKTVRQKGFFNGSAGKESGRHGLDPWVGKIPWSRGWQPTPVFLLGESHGEGSLEAYSPQGHKESDTTEATYHAHSPS